MTMFGRDSIFTSLQALPFVPELAATTLGAGRLQGTRLDDFREEDPGKILHELRYGETAALRGAAALPVLRRRRRHPALRGPAGRVRAVDRGRRAGPRAGARRPGRRWTGSTSTATCSATATSGTSAATRETGLENQCWKDSWDSISYADGRLPGFPRATCELQGYAYDAKVRGARLARTFWNDPALRRPAGAGGGRPEASGSTGTSGSRTGGYFALALDADGKQVDALSSNIGHLLWSGIVDETKAAQVVEHLLGPAPLLRLGRADAGRGRGPVQPDRLPRRHGVAVRQLVHRLGAAPVRLHARRRPGSPTGILDAAELLRRPAARGVRRLRPRRSPKYPVQYPTACSPQAWSTGTPLLLLRTMLGLEPHGRAPGRGPGAADGIGRIELLDIPGRWGAVDAFGPQPHPARPRTPPLTRQPGGRGGPGGRARRARRAGRTQRRPDSLFIYRLLALWQ